jgi:hypothetical protein
VTVVFKQKQEESSKTVCSVLTPCQKAEKARSMPLTAAQRTVFLEDAAQMGIPHARVVQLQQEGIDNVEDLVDFDKVTIEQIVADLRRPAGKDT